MPETRPQAINVSISTGTILKVVAAGLLIWGGYLIADIIVLLIASLFFAAALDPWVDTLQKRYRIPRAVSMFSTYAVLLAVLASAIILIAPPVIDEVQQIAHSFPTYYSRANEWLNGLNVQPGAAAPAPTRNLSDAFTSATGNVVSLATTVFGSIASLILLLFLTYYLVVDEGSIKRSVAIAPKRHQAYLIGLIERLQRQIGIWLRAQFMLMGIVAVLVYALLSIVGMPYALVLALLTGLFEFVPYLGPFLGAVPALLLAYAFSPSMAVAVAVIYYVLHLLESNVIVPKVMEKALGLSPLISIVVFLVGAKLAGIPGVLLAIPLATAATVVLQDTLSARTARAARNA